MTDDNMMNLGSWLGRHQAFSTIASRCSAADAECLKTIRDAGEYKQLGVTWKEFCEKYAGVSRVQADRQIHYLEEFGANYFRMSELMPISPGTYRLIAGAVTDEGLECGGERIPLSPENRAQVTAAVKTIREAAGRKAAPDSRIDSVRKKLNALLAAARLASRAAGGRLELIALIEDGAEKLDALTQALRKKTLVLK